MENISHRQVLVSFDFCNPNSTLQTGEDMEDMLIFISLQNNLMRMDTTLHTFKYSK